MNNELVALRRQVSELQKALDYETDWANGIHHLLLAVLPHLLRDHPEVEKVRDVLRSAAEQFDSRLQNPPQRGKAARQWRQLEAQKVAYRLLALRGVWPGVDSQQAAEESLAHARARQPWPT